ncbi:hypothetical protein ACEZDB_21405 [Streptacidiphilus sp. N1-3]|uniref:Uncharacterized protein n=1 Tax=Streptacidiphilus alkalitolerans TaxID=3342712 RepID=A0ABV6X4L3_9ACTN
MKQHSSSTSPPPPRSRGSVRRPAPGAPVRRIGVLAALGAVAAVLTVLLSGCGIRDTALPVDAGVAASRTACPPAPDATLSKLESDASILPTRPVLAEPVPSVLSKRSAEALASALRAKEAAGQAPGAAAAAPSAPAAPAATATATTADGTLSCLHTTNPSATGSP